MGIIQKERVEGISPASFSDEDISPPEEQNWVVPSASSAHDGESDVHSLPEPSASLEDPRGPGELKEHEAEPMADLPPPVYEIPEEVLQAFYETAIAAGMEEGKNQVLAELGILQERFAGAIDQLVAASHELASRNQVQLVRLACQIAERLVRDELSVRPERLMSLIGQVLREHEARDEVVIRCGPHDYEYIVERQQELVDGSGGVFTVRIEADSDMEYGDFRIETRTGSVDGTVATRMDEIQKNLEEPQTDV